ncbi:DUF6252 family protein [Flavobacterium sp. 270]|uniref:DUF6252 family protein n=1 Tax=Flavobacterium sp. 270 TaxID=2512114 RepID=UPI001065A893|nr:DUF6252 family protein [Flavobacterium sp. 270]
MKKWMFILPLLLIISSCTEDVKFNNPAFQTLKDNVFWRAQNHIAYMTTNGSMTIEGTLGYEKVTLITASLAVKTYNLGVDEVSKASYSNALPGHLASFSTGKNKGNGQIVITEFDRENNTISGTFKFTAINSDAGNVENPKVNFTEGVFYKVPVQVTAEF